MRKLWSTAGLAMLLSLAGCGTVFLPWAETTVAAFDPAAPKDPAPKASLFENTAYGYQLWYGATSAAAFLGVFLLLVVTGPLQPTPPWRSAALLAAGVAVLAVIVAGMALPPPAFRSNPEAGRLILGVSWGLGQHLALGLAGGLTLLGALELRGWVGGRIRQGVEPGEPGPG